MHLRKKIGKKVLQVYNLSKRDIDIQYHVAPDVGVVEADRFRELGDPRLAADGPEVIGLDDAGLRHGRRVVRDAVQVGGIIVCLERVQELPHFLPVPLVVCQEIMIDASESRHSTAVWPKNMVLATGSTSPLQSALHSLQGRLQGCFCVNE